MFMPLALCMPKLWPLYDLNIFLSVSIPYECGVEALVSTPQVSVELSRPRKETDGKGQTDFHKISV
jgi:hypothetical protein